MKLFRKLLINVGFLLGTAGVFAQTMPVISTYGNDTWYYIQFKNGNGVMQDMGENVNVLTKNAVKGNTSQLWKVTGTADNYLIVSQNGRRLVFSGTASRFQASSTNTAVFKFKATTNTSYIPAWELQQAGRTQYMNQYGGAGIDRQLGEWNFADPNNPLIFILPSEMGFKPGKPTSEATITGSSPAPASKLSLWYRTPAADWMTQALPIGNGQFGGMIFGGIKQEEIQFNDKTLWEGNTTSYGAYQNFGSLIINSVGVTAVSNYIRYLDIENAISGVEYDVDGVHYKREYFISNPDSAMVVRYSASQAKKLNLEVMLWDAHGKSPVYNGDNVTIQGKLSLVSYYAKVQVKNEGGTIINSPDGGISVQNADAVTIILAGKTNFSVINPTYIYDAARVPAEVESIVSKAEVKDYGALRSTHVTDYKSLFDRVSLSLGTTSNTVPTNQLITKYASDKDHFLNELYFQFGRYLMISSARGLALPSNLQGIWNNSNTPPWSSDIHSNINVQENYWPAEVTNLSELHNTFLDYIYRESQQRSQWKQNARDAGQSKGWTIYTENNIFGWHGGFMHNYVIANAWYAMHIWQHYRYTMDKDYLLNKAYPVMKSCAEFWMERLISDKGNTTYGFAPDGTLVCPNEYSPEHGPSEDGVAHAQQLVWDLFKNTLEAMDILGTAVAADATFKANLQGKFAKLDDGCHTEEDGGKIYLREWKYTPRSAVGDYGHRHISHLAGLYPGNQISPLINDSIFRAAVVSLDSRGDYSTGWAMGHRITCWARALDGNRAYRILNNALTLSNGGGGIYSNLFDAHPPFQIDGNFAATAAIAELLIQSHIEGILQILPALPDAWIEGQVKGLRAVGNFTVDINWADNVLTTACITSVGGQTCKVNFPFARNATVIDLATNASVSFTAVDENTISFPTVVNGQYIITAGPACETPVFNPAGGKYTTEQSVTITSATEGASIYYTMDGTTPDENSTLYTAPINIINSVNLKAIAVKNGYVASKIASTDYLQGDYIVNIPPATTMTRTDRHLDVIRFSGNMGGSLFATFPTTNPRLVYNDMTHNTGLAVPGEVITPGINFTGSWMHGYIYLDKDNDGIFDELLNDDGTPTAASDIESYSFYLDKNSLGTALTTQNPGVNSPVFIIPPNTVPGIYRIRYKVDWNYIDAGGDPESIIDNGGGIADILVNIHKNTYQMNILKFNGNVLKTDNTPLVNSEIPFGVPIDIVLSPAAGYMHDGVVIKHGYLSNPEFIHGNRQWRLDTIAAIQFVDNKFTIPAIYADGDVEITTQFIPLSGVNKPTIDPNLVIKSSNGLLTVTILTPADVKVYDVAGRTHYSGHISGSRSFKLHSGVYFVNKQKVIVP
ncbi:MAG: glycosyl hydrolase family 95 catalytic domain-containing protein [Paludibacteraceae bacterium]